MRKVLTIFVTLAIFLSLSACKGGETQSTAEEVGNALTEKLEQYVKLTEDQKTTIVQMSQESGMLEEGVRSSDDQAKLKALRERIYNEVLTPEQRTKLDQSNN